MARMQRALNDISQKSYELGLKINIDKTKAMTTRAPNPLQPLTIGTEPLEWVDSYMYLGDVIDKQLTFKEEIKYLKERSNARLAAMGYMSSLKDGTNEHIQRKYYLACTRSLVNYAAPTLINLTGTPKSHYRGNNDVIRLMLGAPMWTRLCNIRLETNLMTLEDRIAQRMQAL
ncbi:uncharacterized protein [Palaemon carinicauda]|uniref:uncharacterized protein n=1 Tax=Palaemon carinicauda TaxID=392227 RepID=UPI0035B67360